MKSIKEIEKLMLEELDAISKDESIAVPEGFAQRLRAGLASRPEKIRSLRIGGIAASAVLLAGIGLGLAGYDDEPEDTYSDPYLAYAEVEKALTMISEGMQRGIDMAHESETVFVRSTEIFN